MSSIRNQNLCLILDSRKMGKFTRSISPPYSLAQRHRITRTMKVNALLYSGLYRMPKGRKRRVPDVAEDEEEAETETCRAPGNEDREDEADADREKEHEKENTSLLGKSIRASTRASRMTTAVVEDDASEDEKLEEEEDKTSRRGKGARPQSRH